MPEETPQPPTPPTEQPVTPNSTPEQKANVAPQSQPNLSMSHWQKLPRPSFFGSNKKMLLMLALFFLLLIPTLVFGYTVFNTSKPPVSVITPTITNTPVPSATTTPIPSPIDLVPTTSSGSAILVEVLYRGGMCVDGGCESKFVFETDGKVTGTNRQTTSLTAQELNNLKLLVQTTDYNQIKSKPFTGTCPIAYDGQEQVYTIYSPQGVQVIESCKTEVDKNAPLFKLIHQVID